MKGKLLTAILVVFMVAMSAPASAQLTTTVCYQIAADVSVTPATLGATHIAGVIVHSTATNASFTATDGALINITWKEPVANKSSGPDLKGTVAIGAILSITSASCTAMLLLKNR